MLRSTIRFIVRGSVLLGFVIAWPAPVRAQETGTVLSIPRVDRAPRIEDFLTGNPPTDASLQVSEFRQREPGDGVPVSHATVAYLSYDDSRLYVVFVCKDEPEKVRATIARREDIDADDQVAIYLDTFLDFEHAYVFASNPLGIQRDAVLTEGQKEDLSFDTVWSSDGRLTADGYIVRMAIPFRSLRFKSEQAKTWRVAIGRVIQRNNEEVYWPYITKRVQGFVPQFGTLNGLARISPGRNVQINPYAVGARARFLDASGPAFRNEGDRRIGMDAKMVVRDGMTVDATANPDFSQVESDDPQVTVNERFEVFFPEKRPFFTENAGYFQTPINLFFSRRIVDPGFGGRLSGKLGRWAVGGLAMNDRAPGRRPSEDPLAGRNAGIGVLRVQREFGNESHLGLLVTDREFVGNFARMFAFDGRWRLGQNWAAIGQFARSGTAKSNAAPVTGSATVAQIRRDGRKLDYQGEYLDFSPTFAAPLGFVKRVGYRQTDHVMKYRWRPRSGAVLKYGPRASALFNWTPDGQLQDRAIKSDFQVEFARNSQIQMERVQAFELFRNLPFHAYATIASARTDWLKWLGFSGSYSWGTAVNHDPAPHRDAFLADATKAEMTVTLRPTTRLRIDQTFVHSALSTRDVSSPIFTDRLLRMKLNYQFSRLLSIRAIVDHAALDADPSLAKLDHERSWTPDVLLTYLVHPGTALFVGYTDRHENLALFSEPFPTVRRTAAPDTSVARQLFVKLSYLWRF